MAKNKICDFCLEEGKGLFKQPEEIAGGYHICKKCRETIEKNGLPVKYDLFQLLVTADPHMRDMIMNDYLENHTADQALAAYFPMPRMLMHKGEHFVNQSQASITVNSVLIPSSKTAEDISDVCHANIANLPDALPEQKAQTVAGTLMETDAALYFLSEHFINCHRLRDIQPGDTKPGKICVREKETVYSYSVPHAGVMRLRTRFYHKITALKQNRHSNLVYISNENEFSLTPGVYEVPKNIPAGTYQVTCISGSDLSIRQPSGRIIRNLSVDMPLVLDDGSALECGGTFRLVKIEK